MPVTWRRGIVARQRQDVAHADQCARGHLSAAFASSAWTPCTLTFLKAFESVTSNIKEKRKKKKSGDRHTELDRMSCSERHKLAHNLACLGLLLLEFGLKFGDLSLKAVNLPRQVSGEMI
jgi:hypothetical protein